MRLSGAEQLGTGTAAKVADPAYLIRRDAAGYVAMLGSRYSMSREVPGCA